MGPSTSEAKGSALGISWSGCETADKCCEVGTSGLCMERDEISLVRGERFVELRDVMLPSIRKNTYTMRDNYAFIKNQRLHN